MESDPQSTKKAVILAIESSCDETAAAVLADGELLSNVVAGQDVHAAYGGVVPELASRAHQQNVVPVVDQALKQAGVAKEELSAIAFTQGPGLLGALLVGVSFGKALAAGLGVPIIGVHHMKAHILAHFLEDPKPTFPFLCLTVSGGHTQLVLVKDYLDMQVVGQTADDAVGEAFDKTAKLMGLPYPGGPLIDRFAQDGDPNAFAFPKPDVPGLDFSFSGIKTAFLYFLQNNQQKDPAFIPSRKADICASVQKTLVGILTDKLEQAAEQYKVNQIAIAGGVSANSRLRAEVERLGRERGWRTFVPRFDYCTDNAAMIGMAAHYQFLAGQTVSQRVSPAPRMGF